MHLSICPICIKNFMEIAPSGPSLSIKKSYQNWGKKLAPGGVRFSSVASAEVMSAELPVTQVCRAAEIGDDAGECLENRQRVGVVGAGISGLVLATELQANLGPKVKVTVLEWGRGPGGRTARRRVQLENGEEVGFDHARADAELFSECSVFVFGVRNRGTLVRLLYQAPGTRYIPGTQYQVPGIRYRYPAPATAARCLVPGT
jgi:hypothetical protein